MGQRSLQDRNLAPIALVPTRRATGCRIGCCLCLVQPRQPHPQEHCARQGFGVVEQAVGTTARRSRRVSASRNRSAVQSARARFREKGPKTSIFSGRSRGSDLYRLLLICRLTLAVIRWARTRPAACWTGAGGHEATRRRNG
jgi:hypothetical protein